MRRILGIEATYFSRVSKWSVWNQALRPQLPSTTIQLLQVKALANIVCSSPDDPMHNIVFCHPLKDRIQAQGRRRGMQFPYWVEVTMQRHLPEVWAGDHTARGSSAKQLYDQNEQYVILGKLLKTLRDPAEQARMALTNPRRVKLRPRHSTALHGWRCPPPWHPVPAVQRPGGQ